MRPSAQSSPARPVAARENLMAASTPSLPELQKKTRFTRPPAFCTRRCASSRGKFRNVALQHRRAAAVEFLFERGDDRRVVVAGVVDAITRKKVEDTAAVGGEELHTGAAVVVHVHLQQVQQPHPLRVDVVGIQTI